MYILTLCKNSKICVPESGNATVKHFIETVEFKRILKIKLSPIFWFLKVFLINRFFFSTIQLITIGRYKKQIKNILHRDKQKRDKKIEHKPYLTALSNRTVKKVGRRVGRGGGGGCQNISE